nr:MucR family transcriptional regulator [uncultured Sphingomonas sp.]
MAHGLTPDEYRTRYRLPRDYPMVPPSYSAQRREFAKKMGLGHLRKRRDPTSDILSDAAAPEPAALRAPSSRTGTNNGPC